jgi:hypothetical protein
MRTIFQALGLSLGLGLLGMSAPALVSADATLVNSAHVAPGRPTQQVRQDLRQARHRRGVVAEVPELNAGMAAQALCVMLGTTLIISDRRRRAA